ncbi:MAG: leucine-rich repeat domain-containing protein, partial [Promethearchaeota archaeon]
MALTPQRIYKEFRKNNLDKNSTLNLLISLIENSNDLNLRLEAIRAIDKICIINNRLFKFLENLLISDSCWEIRNAATRCLKHFFINDEKCIPILKWALKYEKSFECIKIIIDFLVSINNQESKSVLINEINKILKKKYIIADKKFTNKSFKKDLSQLFKIRKIEDFSHKELADIIINYKVITALKEKFYSVYYELENGLVTKLDLSDIEFEVRGWIPQFKNNITNLSEIIGLKNLKNLKYLYLANNQIESIKDLVELENLTHLYISNNKIKETKNINYIKEMAKRNLQFIDLSE